MFITDTALLTALSPVAIAFGTTLGNKLGEGVAAAVHTEAKQLADRVRAKFDGDAEATAALDLYCAKPTEQYAGILEPHLDRFKVAQDPGIASMVEHITSKLGPVASGPGGVAAGAINQNISGSGSAIVGGVHITNNQAPARTPDVRWSVTHHSGSTYAIENTGTADALDVELAAENVIRFDPPEYDNPTWPPGEPRIVFCDRLDGRQPAGGHPLPHHPRRRRSRAAPSAAPKAVTTRDQSQLNVDLFQLVRHESPHGLRCSSVRPVGAAGTTPGQIGWRCAQLGL